MVTKPGYGILSEAMSTATPLVLDSRHDFREFETIRKVLEPYPQVAFVEHSEIESLRIGETLERVLQPGPRAWPDHCDGAGFIVERIDR